MKPPCHPCMLIEDSFPRISMGKNKQSGYDVAKERLLFLSCKSFLVLYLSFCILFKKKVTLSCFLSSLSLLFCLTDITEIHRKETKEQKDIRTLMEIIGSQISQKYTEKRQRNKKT